MTVFTAPDRIGLADMMDEAKAEILLGSGFLSVVIFLGLVLAVGNARQGRAGRDEINFIGFVGDLLHSLIR